MISGVIAATHPPQPGVDRREDVSVILLFAYLAVAAAVLISHSADVCGTRANGVSRDDDARGCVFCVVALLCRVTL